MENEQVETPEENDDDFEAGFSGTEAQPQAKETSEPAAATTKATPAAPVAEPAPTVQADQPETVQVTKADFERLTRAADATEELRRRQDQVFGKIGSFEDTLRKLQQETPAGQSVEVSEDDFEDLAKEFPDIAALSVKGLNKVLGKLRGTGGQAPIDTTQFEQVVEQRVSKAVGEVRSQIVEEVLGDRHPDWKTLRDKKPADYTEWLSSLAEQDRVSYLNSDSPYFVAKKLDEFKAFRTAKAAAAEKGKQPPPAKTSRKEIIQAAVTPRGTGGQPTAPSGEDDFEAGFNRYAPAG